MSKFTFFTILFAVIIIFLVSQLVLKDALFPQEYQTSVLEEAEVKNEDVMKNEENEENAAEEEHAAKDVVEERNVAETKEEFPVPSASQESSFLKIDMLKQVGFQNIKQVDFSGKLFDLFDIKNTDVENAITFSADNSAILTEIKMRDEISAQELYKLLQNKTKVFVDLFINETNLYGDRAFYINHRKKRGEAFLVIKMKNYLYAFAYGKDLHPRIKTLISFLYTDILDQQI